MRRLGVRSRHQGARLERVSASSPRISRPVCPPVPSRQKTIEGMRGAPSISTSSTRPSTAIATAVDVVPKSIARTQPDTAGSVLV